MLGQRETSCSLQYQGQASTPDLLLPNPASVLVITRPATADPEIVFQVRSLLELDAEPSQHRARYTLRYDLFSCLKGKMGSAGGRKHEL